MLHQGDLCKLLAGNYCSKVPFSHQPFALEKHLQTQASSSPGMEKLECKTTAAELHLFQGPVLTKYILGVPKSTNDSLLAARLQFISCSISRVDDTPTLYR